MATTPTTSTPTSTPTSTTAGSGPVVGQVSGWDTHRAWGRELDAWVTRQDDLAAGAPVEVTATDLEAYAAVRGAMLRAVFRRWTLTLEGALGVQVDRGVAPDRAIRRAVEHTAAYRPADARLLCREAADPLLAELAGPLHRRLAHLVGVPELAGLVAAEIETAAATVAPPRTYLVLTPRPARPRRWLIARRAV